MSLSPDGDWVSQVAYRLPARSVLRSPSIHHSVSERVPTLPPTTTAGDHVLPPSVERVNCSCPGCTLNVRGLRGWSIIKASATPLGCMRMEASYPPPAGKPGCIVVIGPHVLPESVDFWTTAVASTAPYAQLPVGLQ